MIRSLTSARRLFIDLQNVRKVFTKGERSTEALAGVDLTVDGGDFVALVGPSGCGKSTLLRLLAGLDAPTSGDVLVTGEAMDTPRSSIGLMLQQPTLFLWRTALSNVLLPVDVHRRRTKADVERARELLALVGLETYANHHSRELSGGMQQRVALCRVLMTDPEILLLDEPFGSLDEFTRETLNVELARMVEARSGTTVILVTHNIAEAVSGSPTWTATTSTFRWSHRPPSPSGMAGQRTKRSRWPSSSTTPGSSSETQVAAGSSPCARCRSRTWTSLVPSWRGL